MAYKDIEKDRAAKRRYYDSHREVYLNKNRRKKEFLRNVMRKHKSKPCSDCGGFPFYVMDFDHREGEQKLAHVSRLVQMVNLERLLSLKLLNATWFAPIVTASELTGANKDFPG